MAQFVTEVFLPLHRGVQDRRDGIQAGVGLTEIRVPHEVPDFKEWHPCASANITGEGERAVWPSSWFASNRSRRVARTDRTAAPVPMTARIACRVPVGNANVDFKPDAI